MRYALPLPRKTLALFCLFLTLSGPCLAADASVADELVSQAESFRKEKEKKPLTVPEKPEITVGEKKEAPAVKKVGEFYLKKIVLEGNTIFPEKVLEKLVFPYQNRRISSDELDALVQSLTAFYRSQGYLTSRAYFPPQQPKDGTITIQILEGKIGDVRVIGNRHFSTSLYLQALHLRKDRIFRYQDLENSLYALNQKPDRHVKASLVAGKTPGTSDLVLNVTETGPFHANYALNNTGTKLTHYYRHNVEFKHNNLTGRGDVLSSGFAGAEEGAMTAVSLIYAYPLNQSGTTLNASASFVKTMLVRYQKSAEIKGNSLNLSPGITKNFFLSTAMSLDGYIGLDVKESKTTADDLKIDFDRMRILRAGPRLSFHDAQGVGTLSGDAHLGIPRFLNGLSPVDRNASVLNAGGEFAYYTVDASRIHFLPWESYLVLRGGGQWTDDTLTSSEQYRAGGVSSVRGYPESDSAGDYGYDFSAELSLPAPGLPKEKIFFYPTATWRNSTRCVVFVDGAKTFFRDKTTEASVRGRFLLGVGFGVRFDLGRNASLRCDAGFPIGDASTDSRHVQVHFSLRGGF